MAGGLRYLNDRQQWMMNHPGPLQPGQQPNPPGGNTPSAAPQTTQVGGYNVPGANPPQQVVQPGMPGQLDMIARQLGMGGYGDMAGIRQHMDQFYKPMSMPNYGATPIPQPSNNMQGPNPKATTPWENSPWAQAQAAARGQQPARQMPSGGGWFDRWNAGRK